MHFKHIHLHWIWKLLYLRCWARVQMYNLITGSCLSASYWIGGGIVLCVIFPPSIVLSCTTLRPSGMLLWYLYYYILPSIFWSNSPVNHLFLGCWWCIWRCGPRIHRFYIATFICYQRHLKRIPGQNETIWW